MDVILKKPLNILKASPTDYHFVHPLGIVHNVDLRITTDCNLRCSFCYQHKHEIMQDPPFNGLLEKLKLVLQSTSKTTINVVVHGGEVLQDKYPIEYYQKLDTFFNDIKSAGLEHNKTIKLSLCSNIIHHNTSFYVNLLNSNNISLHVSYDCVGRFNHDKQKQLFIDNLQIYKNKLGYVGVQLVLTKSNIKAIIGGSDKFLNDVYQLVGDDWMLEHYHPTSSTDNEIVDEDLLYQLLIHCYSTYPNMVGEYLRQNVSQCCSTLITPASIYKCCTTPDRIKQFMQNKKCFACRYYNHCGVNMCVSTRYNFKGCALQKFYDQITSGSSFKLS